MGTVITMLAIVFGILVLRAVAWRATLGLRTLVCFGVVGAAYAVFWNPIVVRVVNPLYESGVLIQLVSALALQLLLVAPFAWILVRKGAMNRLSVADLWLAGFSVGFGHDLAAFALIVTRDFSNWNDVAKFGWLPPLAISGEHFASAGYGYWTALIAVAAAVVLRLTGSRIVSWCVGCGVACVMACDAPLYFGATPNLLQRAMSVAGLHGHLMSWLSLLALIFAQLLESAWLKKRASQAEAAPGLGGWFAKLQTGNLSAAHEAWNEIALKRRNQIGTANGEEPVSAGAVEAQATVAVWRNPSLWCAVLWLLLFVVLYVPKATEFLSTKLALDFPGFFGLTPVNLILAVVIVWSYLSAGYIAANEDELLQLKCEWAMLRTAFWGLVIGVIIGAWSGFYSFFNVMSAGGIGLPNFNDATLTTLALSFGAVMSSFSWARIIRWRTADANLRRGVMVNRFFAALCCVLLAIVSYGKFIDRYEAFHQAHGYTGFNISQLVGTNGNKIVAYWFMSTNLLRVLPLALLLWFISWRVSKWFYGETPGVAERVGTTVAVVGVIAWLGAGHAFAGNCLTANECICYPPGATPAINMQPAPLGLVLMDKKSRPPKRDGTLSKK